MRPTGQAVGTLVDVAGGESCTSSCAHETFITSSPVLCLRFLYSLWKSFVVCLQASTECHVLINTCKSGLWLCIII